MADTVIVLNARAGTIRDRKSGEVEAIVRAAFESRGGSVDVALVEGNAFIQTIDRAAASGAGTLIVGGGDGSVGYACRKLAGGQQALGVLPLGTMNLFARTLGIPSDLEPALETLASAAPRRIDLASVNGRIFHTLSGLGYFAEVARARARVREETSLPFGRYIAAARASLRAFTRTGVLHLVLETEAGRREIDAYALFVSNNRLSETGIDRDSLEEGLIEVHYAEGAEFGKRMQAAIDVIAGHWRENPAIESFETRRASVTSHRSRLWLSVDGELTRMKTPLVFESLPKAITILMPESARSMPKPA